METVTQQLAKQVLSNLSQTESAFTSGDGSQPLLGFNILAFAPAENAQNFKAKISEIAGQQYEVVIHKTLIADTFNIKIKIKDYAKVNGGMFYKSVTLILNKFIQNSIQFTSLTNIYN